MNFDDSIKDYLACQNRWQHALLYLKILDNANVFIDFLHQVADLTKLVIVNIDVKVFNYSIVEDVTDYMFNRFRNQYPQKSEQQIKYEVYTSQIICSFRIYGYSLFSKTRFSAKPEIILSDKAILNNEPNDGKIFNLVAYHKWFES